MGTRLRGSNEKDKALEMFGEHPSASPIGLSAIRDLRPKANGNKEINKDEINEVAINEGASSVLEIPQGFSRIRGEFPEVR